MKGWSVRESLAQVAVVARRNPDGPFSANCKRFTIMCDLWKSYVATLFPVQCQLCFLPLYRRAVWTVRVQGWVRFSQEHPSG